MTILGNGVISVPGVYVITRDLNGNPTFRFFRATEAKAATNFMRDLDEYGLAYTTRFTEAA